MCDSVRPLGCGISGDHFSCNQWSVLEHLPFNNFSDFTRPIETCHASFQNAFGGEEGGGNSLYCLWPPKYSTLLGTAPSQCIGANAVDICTLKT